MAKETADWASGMAMAIRNACGPEAASMDTRTTGSTYPYARDALVNHGSSNAWLQLADPPPNEKPSSSFSSNSSSSLSSNWASSDHHLRRLPVDCSALEEKRLLLLLLVLLLLDEPSPMPGRE